MCTSSSLMPSGSAKKMAQPILEDAVRFTLVIAA